ncbi:MAG TPA: alkaline phosphatase family protein, partial [Rugosimonospora sp.]|nr:alkaline phosphatase family protein [Rugosimonospora sp.]
MGRSTAVRAWFAVLVTAWLVLAGCGAPAGHPPAPSGTSTASAPPALRPSAEPPGGPPAHVLVVIFENKAFEQVDGAERAPYLDELASRSAVYTDLHAITHPSQPNYLALFSGSTQGVTDDHCPVRLHGRPNLARQLIDAGRTFAGYSEGLPRAGYTGCSSGAGYAAKHNPWVDFDNVPATANQPASAMPVDYALLPTVAFLVPSLCDDMHDCPVGIGDAWAKRYLDPYATWAAAHDSLLVVTFDEDDGHHGNRIFTLLSGAG